MSEANRDRNGQVLCHSDFVLTARQLPLGNCDSPALWRVLGFQLSSPGSMALCELIRQTDKTVPNYSTALILTRSLTKVTAEEATFMILGGELVTQG